MKKNVALIGLGKQNTKDHLIAMQQNEYVEIVAVCDRDESLALEWGKRLNVKSFTSVDEMISDIELDAAIVAVPHFAYFPIIEILAENGIHILKEKPLAMTYDEAVRIDEIVQKTGINLTVAVQRKHNKIYNSFLEYVKHVGEIFSIHAHYTLNIAELDGDWRSSRELAGGGAVIDMGYHLIDLLIWYFGVPERISAELGYHNRIGQNYDVEDTAKIQFSYSNNERRILGSALLSRIYPEKDETLTVYGTKGSIVLYKDRIELKNMQKELIESIYIKSNGHDIKLQFDTFVASLDDDKTTGNYKDHLKNMAFIDAVYVSDAESRTVTLQTESKYDAAIKLNEETSVIV